MRRHCVLNVQCLHDGLFLLFWLDVYFAQVKQCTYICLFTTPHPLSLSHTHTCKHSESHDSLFSSIHHHQYSFFLLLLSSIKTVIFRYFITLSCARHAAINLTNLSKCWSYFLQCFVPLCVCVYAFLHKSYCYCRQVRLPGWTIYCTAILWVCLCCCCCCYFFSLTHSCFVNRLPRLMCANMQQQQKQHPLD